MEHSSPKDALLILGGNPDYIINDKKIIYCDNVDFNTEIALYKRAQFFLHLSYIDHCPNCVVSAVASGCHIIASDSGGTKELLKNATIINETDEWDYKPINTSEPPVLDFTKKTKPNPSNNSDIDIISCGKKYIQVFEKVLKNERK